MTAEEAPRHSFDEETWQQLPAYFEQLPRPVEIRVWGDPAESLGEREAARMAESLGRRFAKIEFRLLPRRIHYNFYPVFGFMASGDEDPVDHGLRIVGLPAGYQITSLIAAVQAVAFAGATLEPASRIQLQGLQQDVRIEVISAANDDEGAAVAKSAFGLAVASPHIRTYLLMGDVFPEAQIRYSVRSLPHTVINGRTHISGYLDEAALLRQVAAAVKRG